MASKIENTFRYVIVHKYRVHFAAKLSEVKKIFNDKQILNTPGVGIVRW